VAAGRRIIVEFNRIRGKLARQFCNRLGAGFVTDLSERTAQKSKTVTKFAYTLDMKNALSYYCFHVIYKNRVTDLRF
jgi:hypothetical protein